MWVNKEVAVTFSSWQSTNGGVKGAYVYTMEYTAFSEINKFPSAYFIDSDGQVWSVEVQYNSTTNPTTISVYSNRNIKGTIVICSNSGYIRA